MEETDSFRKVELIIDYFFGKGSSRVLSKRGYRFVYSPKSGRVKHIYHDGKLFATIRPNGSVALTPYSAKILLRAKSFKRNCVIVNNDAAVFIKKGFSVFNKFVIEAGNNIRPGSEVIVLDEQKRPLAIGTAVLSSKAMVEFKKGVAVKVRKCIQ